MPFADEPGAAADRRESLEPIHRRAIRRLPNGELAPAHRYEDELARMRAEEIVPPP